MKSPRLPFHATLLATALLLASAGACAALSFETDIRPILQRHCVECHGAKKQKGELRLDAKIFALRGGAHGEVFVPGKADLSPLLHRVISENEDERMPPKGERLTPAEVASLKAWVDSGAQWPENENDREAARDRRLEHWAVKPVRALFPAEASIDFYVRSALASKGLTPSGEADRRTLIRRLSFDLHGLPPDPDRVDAFVRDPDPGAYEKLVDELLASPHYGERWARHWLDIAHYADTHGFERDKMRPNAWRYRDYLIQALNSDKPYDQFLREQIAGDVIAPGDSEAVCATGFLAAGPWDFVGQVETRSDVLRRAARAADLDDMVTQVITSTMGITIHCARCHDHKLDPISQTEYYSLWAVFAGASRADREINPAESQRLQNEKNRLQGRIAETTAALAMLAGGSLDLADLIGGGDGFGSGVAGRGIDLLRGTPLAQKRGYATDVKTNRLQKVDWPAGTPGQAGFVKWVFVPDGKQPVPVDTNLAAEGVPATNGQAWDAIRNGVLNAQRHAKIGEIDYARGKHSVLGMHANSGVTFDLEKIRRTSGFGDLRLSAALGFGSDPAAALSLADFTVFLDGIAQFQRIRMRKNETADIDLEVPRSAKTLTLVATDGGDGIGNDLLFLGDARLLAFGRGESLTDAEKARIEELNQTLAVLRTQLASIKPLPSVFAVSSETHPPPVRVQRRGNPEDPTTAVQPGAFAWPKHASAAFGYDSMPEGERRRALADWIAHPNNPLTPRVLVNRLWHHHFGRGIVATPSDFGLGGEAPSHPELLDWLACEFMRGGWKLKPLHKRMVLSATYRQSSLTPNREAAAMDAQNRLLWRQNPRRLDAESLRDAVLAVSGKLNPARGGPGFQDFQYTEAYAPIYEYKTPDNPELWKRSIYRFVVRTSPHRFLTTLDCPDPANLTPARIQTTTALQALTLSNNAFILKQAQYLAARAGELTRSTEESVRRAFTLCLQREANSAELSAACALAAEQGLFSVCRMLLNSNEFLYLD